MYLWSKIAFIFTVPSISSYDPTKSPHVPTIIERTQEMCLKEDDSNLVLDERNNSR